MDDAKKQQQQAKGYEKVSDDLWINRASGTYYVRKWFRGTKLPPLFVSTGEKKIRLAKLRADELIRAHVTHHEGLGTQRRTVAQVIEEVLQTVTPTRRTGTQTMHRIYLGELAREWEGWALEDVTLAAWANWLASFRRRKNRKTFADYQKHMNLVLRYAYRQRYMSHLLTLPMPDKKHEAAGRVFSRDEIRALWDAMSEETRDQFILCYECFMRLREALYLTWDRVDLEKGIVTLRAEDVKTGSKTGKGRAFYMSPRALERMRARRERVKGPWVFPSPDRSKPTHDNKHAWQHAKREAGIEGRARWHDLRHTALSVALLEEKMQPVLVSEYAGVSLRTIQRVYLHSTHEQTAPVAQAINIFSPRKL